MVLSFLLCAAIGFARDADSNLKITQLSGDFYVYTTYNVYKGQRISANGMYLLTDAGAVVFDTPWDTTQFQPLLDSIQAKHGQRVVLSVSTHFHEDRTGGLAHFRKQGIRTYTTRLTDSFSQLRGMPRAEFLMARDTVFTVGQYSFRTIYPGHGHAPDNIVIWFGRERILYGGCLIKSVQDNSLGNLADASVQEYAKTIKRVQQACPEPAYIITGHNDWTDARSLKHTLKMARKLRRRSP
jgi:metallo-beta-lactamase class B